MLKSIQNRLNKISSIEKEIKKIQKKCPHAKFEATRGSNAGNLDGFDIYWVNFCCKDCGFHEVYYSDEDKEQYKKYAKYLKLT